MRRLFDAFQLRVTYEARTRSAVGWSSATTRSRPTNAALQAAHSTRHAKVRREGYRR